MPPTIFALSSGRLPAAIAIVRISGPAAFMTLAALTRKSVPPLRVMTLATIHDPRSGAALDRALVVRFAAEASATGEALVELHLHGSSAVVAAVLDALGALTELRLAQPGEFTRQAFDNGKIDLTEVEGLSDLIAATTEVQRVRALEATRGSLRQAVERWRCTILQTLVSIESELDFAEEQADVSTATSAAQITALLEVQQEIGALLTHSGRGERLRDGLTVAIVGAPNVGKSSLMNALARRDVAIVSPAAGTTRDIIELPFELAGIPLTLIDTAGLRDDASDPAEQEGIARARRRTASADLVLHLCTEVPAQPLGTVVINKIDLIGQSAGIYGDRLYISAVTGAGLDELHSWLADWARLVINPGELIAISTRRQANVLTSIGAALDDAVSTSELVLQANALQISLRALASLSGSHRSEDVLAQIFSQFCIGK